eukprot:365237-Chlamydomonas_euryale.AAC.11
MKQQTRRYFALTGGVELRCVPKSARWHEVPAKSLPEVFGQPDSHARLADEAQYVASANCDAHCYAHCESGKAATSLSVPQKTGCNTADGK